MSEYATKWESISKDEFLKLFEKEMNVYSTFTNFEPSRLSQEPQILTTWGFEKELVKEHIRDYRLDGEHTEYFKATEWE